MFNRYDIAYWLGLGLAAPFWLIKPSARRKVLRAFRERMGNAAARDTSRPAIMIHAVSVGELNATTTLVQMLRRARPGLSFIISTTSDTGFTRSQQLYGEAGDVTLIRYPLDFSRGIKRVLDRLKPSLVVLMELEVWPNFLLLCQKRGVPVVLANGRLSDHSYRNYKLIRPVVATMFRRIAQLCVQDEHYAAKFIHLGAPPERVHVVGNMKFDTAEVSRRIAGDAEVAEAVGLFPGQQPIWVCGSTGPGEEAMILRVYRELLNKNARLRLVIVPRQKPRFDEVAELIESMKFRVVRRSKQPDGSQPPPINGVIPPVVLGDTMGELRKFYSTADVIFVGRTLVDLGSKQHGSDMIEPAALARPVVVGPYTGNFADAMYKLRQVEGVLVVQNEKQLGETIAVLLSSRERASEMGDRAQEAVLREQGATLRHAQIILETLDAAEKRVWEVIVK